MSCVVEANVAVDLNQAVLLLFDKFTSYVGEGGIDERDISLAIDNGCCGLALCVDDQ